MPIFFSYQKISMASGWLDVQCHSLFLGGKSFFGQKTTIQRGNFLK